MSFITSSNPLLKKQSPLIVAILLVTACSSIHQKTKPGIATLDEFGLPPIKDDVEIQQTHTQKIIIRIPQEQ